MKRFHAALCTGIAALIVASPALAGTNLLVNPGFEALGGSYDGWTTFGNGVQLSAASGDNIVRSGAEASKIFGEFNGCPIPNFDVGGYFQTFTPTVGDVYTFSGHSYIANGDPLPGTLACQVNRAVAKIVFFNDVGGGQAAEITSNEIIIGDGNFPIDTWVPFEIEMTAPAGAVRVDVLILFIQPACDTGAVYVDDLSLCADTAPIPGSNLLTNPGFDLSLAGWTTFGNVSQETRGESIPGFAFERRTPPGVMKIFGTFVEGSDSGAFQSFAASPGQEFEMLCWSLNTCSEGAIEQGNDNVATMVIGFFDGTLPDPIELASVATVIGDENAPLGTWTQHRVVAQAPPGTVTVRAFFIFASPSLLGGNLFIDDAEFRAATITGAPAVAQGPSFELRQNAPNPFSAGTTIEFAVPSRDDVSINVYDIAGRKVASLVDGPVNAGVHRAQWDGLTVDGQRAASGVYHYVLETSLGRQTKRMMLVK